MVKDIKDRGTEQGCRAGEVAIVQIEASHGDGNDCANDRMTNPSATPNQDRRRKIVEWQNGDELEDARMNAADSE